MEVAVRLWGYSEHHIYDPIYMPFAQTKDIPYIHKPNLVNVRARGMAIINTDSLGLRAKTAGLRHGPKQKHEYRIAIVGDSVTFGEGVPNIEDTFAKVLEDTLNWKQTVVKVSVFNYGASAYSVKQMAGMLQYRMFDIEPDLVVMAIISADFDLTRTLAVDGSGYLVDTKFSSINPDSTIRSVLRRMRLTYVLRDILYSWFVTREDIHGILAKGVLPESYLYVRRFKELADKHGLPSIIVLLPMARADSFDGVVRQLQRDEVAFVNLSSLSSEFTLDRFMASQFDRHPSPAVHHRIGEALAEYIFQRQLLTAVKTTLELSEIAQ